MATEYKLSYTASEINTKLGTVDETKASLENNYYTSTEVDTKFTETNESVDTKISEANTALESSIGSSLANSLGKKADLVDGKVPANQIPDGIVDLSGYYTKTETDENLANKADIVDGKVPVEQLPDDIGGGVETWDELGDKPFGEVSTLVPIIENKNIEMVDMSEGAGLIYAGILEEDTTPFQETYSELNVLYNGTSYNVTRKWSDDMEAYYFGNLSIYNVMGVDFEDTGEPFLIAMFDEVMFIVNDSAATQTVTVSTIEESIKTIDKKYIPSEIGTWEAMPDKPFYDSGYNFTQEDIDSAEVSVSASVEDTEIKYWKVSEPVSGTLEGWKLSFLVDSDENLMVIGEDVDIITTDTGSSYIMYVLNIATDNETVNLEEAGLTFTVANKGLYIFDFSTIGLGFNYLQSSDFGIKTIDKKFIPDDITAAVSLTFDETPTEGSQNPVKSMGIHSAISALEGKITSTFCYKGTVANYTDLPTSDNTVGDVWNITNADETNSINAGDNAAWNGTGWDILAGVIDLSDYYTKTEIDSIALNGTVNLANYYTKAEIDDMIGDCDTIINSINTLVGGGTV